MVDLYVRGRSSLGQTGVFVCVDLSGSPAEDGTPPASAASASEAGPLFSVQCHGAHTPHVHVRSARSLDGLHLVRHRAERNGAQR